ncbi:helix-turn-helix domain-containing protein [Streptomyces sp. NPDC046978]|uniref:helix-turn-helix domain-containing protein n=1 Tax=Streptomyces sp. NPDC046978 TaxID=3154704 RepID=UPI0033FC35C9
MSDEEVRRVSDALDAVDAIADPEERARAQSAVMAETRERGKRWSEERSALVQRLKNEENESIRGIARRLGISPSTVQDILRGYKGSGQRRPPAAERNSKSADEV